MKIGTRSLYSIYLYVFAIFIDFKVWRAFSGSTEQGGIWNYIQVFYVLCGAILLFQNIALLKREKTILFMALYSCWAFFGAVLTIPDFTLSTMYGLLKTLFPTAVFTIFYLYSNKIETLEKHALIVKITFYLGAAILIRALSQYMGVGAFRASGAGAVADVYYILGLLPYIMAVSGKKEKLLSIFVTAICIFLSQKRAGFIILAGVILIFYLLRNKRNIKDMLKTIVGVVCTGLVLYYLIVYMDQAFNLRFITRLMLLESDGGSGRLERWNTILEEYANSDAFEIVFGHGYSSVERLVGGNAHNDFLQILFQYGVIPLIFYLGYFVNSFFTGLSMKNDGYEKLTEYFSSVLISFCLACFSFYVIDATYIICGCFVQGVFIADWRKRRQIKI